MSEIPQREHSFQCCVSFVLGIEKSCPSAFVFSASTVVSVTPSALNTFPQSSHILYLLFPFSVHVAAFTGIVVLFKCLQSRLLTVSFSFTTIIPSVDLFSCTYILLSIDAKFKLPEAAALSTSIPSCSNFLLFWLYAYTFAFSVPVISVTNTYKFPCDTVILGSPNVMSVFIVSKLFPSYTTIFIVLLLVSLPNAK